MRQTPGQISGSMNRAYSVQLFVKRVTVILSALIAVSTLVIFLLVYLPLKKELEKSLIDNFSQLSAVNYHSLQNSINRGLEGARSLSSRSMIRQAMSEYSSGEMSLEELAAYTQPKYEEGAAALEYLLLAERFAGKSVIARVAPANYEESPCFIDRLLKVGTEVNSSLCLRDGQVYFAVFSPIFSDGQMLGYDRLIFNLTGQIHMLCTDTTETLLLYEDGFQALLDGAQSIHNTSSSRIFYKQEFYYHTLPLQDTIHFVSRQSEDALFAPVHPLSRQTLLVGIFILIAFTAAIYFSAIRFAKNELRNLEDSRNSYKKAASEANMDPLTGAGNRRYGEEALALAFERFQRKGLSPAIVLFDIDSLKHINDTYGHSAGDMIIRSVAETVREHIRGDDMLFRWGGDEFVGIFEGLTKGGTLPFAQKLLDIVSKLKVDTGAGKVSPTISVGAACFEREDRSFIDAINRADRAMYQSKAQGRNRANEL